METHMHMYMDRFRVAQSTPPARQCSDNAAASSSTSARIPSCDRCRYSKKKCSRTPPECLNCRHAGLTCSLGISDTTANEGLRKRLAWLQDFVNKQNLFGDWKAIEQVVTGTDLSRATNQLHSEGQERNSEPLATTSPVTFSTLTPPATAPSPSLPAATYSNNEDDAARSDLRPAKRIRLHEPTITEQPPSATSSSTNATAPATEYTPTHIKEPDARALVDAYFLDVNRAYPFVNRSMVLDALQANGNRIPPLRDCEATSTILYLIMAIGFTSLQRAGQVPSTTQWHFPIEYKEVLSECIIQESINTVQILLLLAIYSVCDPRGFATRSIVDILCRQAIRIGLTRRNIADQGLNQAEAEHNHRLFWSIYIFDSMIGVSTGTSLALDGIETNIPLPGITVEEFASPDVGEYISMLQVSRHIIHLRQLESRVLREFHNTNSLSSKHDQRVPTRCNNVQHLRTEIEDWYSNGCLLKCPDPDSNSVRIHIRIPWLASRYYNLLLLLYYPSETNQAATQIPISELAAIAQKHIQANHVRFQQHQLPLNHITLSRLLPVAMVFLHCYIHRDGHENTRVMLLSIKDEVNVCADILAAFPSEWDQAHRAASSVRQLATLIAATSNAHNGTPLPSPCATSTDEARAWCHTIKLSLSEMMEQVLGRGSVYRLLSDMSSTRHAHPDPRTAWHAETKTLPLTTSYFAPTSRDIEGNEACIDSGIWANKDLSIIDFL